MDRAALALALAALGGAALWLYTRQGQTFSALAPSGPAGAPDWPAGILPGEWTAYDTPEPIADPGAPWTVWEDYPFVDYPTIPIGPVDLTTPESFAFSVPVPDNLRGIVLEAAVLWEVPPDYFARQLWQESRFNARAVSPAGAQGIAQFMPTTTDWWRTLHGWFDPWEPSSAIPAAAHYDRWLFDQLGNWPDTFAAYNWGMARVQRLRSGGGGSPPTETRNYVQIITGATYV